LPIPNLPKLTPEAPRPEGETGAGATDDAPEPAPQPDGTERGEEGKPGGKRQKPISRAEAEVLVREWLAQHAKDNPTDVTRDGIAAGTGVSTGMVSTTTAWKVFRDRRAAEAKPMAREVPLSEKMEAVIPANCPNPAELAALIEEQEREKAEEDRLPERRHKRRHKPS
ncbi:MAG TPA: hypothetical protein VKE74_01680, partial [Gemmataceae bacterium]|nr:hypothetical protein [Gemmataceae bacterium]